MADAIQDLRHETTEVQNLIARLRDLCGDDERAFIDTLEGETEVVEAARRVVRWLHEQDAHKAACKALASTYAARASVFGERVERARMALFHFLNEMGLRAMPLPEATLSVVAGRAALVGDADPVTLPEKFVRVTREPNRSAIKEALEAGETVEGFSLSNGSPTLAVRVR